MRTGQGWQYSNQHQGTFVLQAATSQLALYKVRIVVELTAPDVDPAETNFLLILSALVKW